jgi:general secretion pathway protein L
MPIKDMPGRWVVVLAELLAAGFAWWRARRSLVVTQEDGRFVVRGSRGGNDHVVAETARGTPLPIKAAQALHKHFIVFELAPDKVVTRHLTVPTQAREFVAGIVGNQIERLSPWRPAQAIYGIDVEPSQTDAKSLDVSVLIASRATIETIRDQLTEISLSPHQIVVRTGSGKRNASVALWTRFASGPQGKAQNLPMIVGASLAALVLLSTAVSLWSLQSTNSIRAEYEDISIRTRALQKQSQSSRKNRDLASLSPVERAWALKETLPAAVLVLEALTRALPDSAYLTELHLENATLRITGLAADAPSLIAALEQSGRFSDVHFFAPTAKGTEGALYRFHIEGQVDVPVETVGD